MLLITNVDLHAPARRGRADLLVAGERIVHVADRIERPGKFCQVYDAGGAIAAPGLVDCHVHVAGGGGEGGYATRTPELLLSDAIRGGVTTVVGCLGTDGVTRHPAGLLAKVRGLEDEGITAFMWTGHYAVPVHTLTGSIERDLLLIDKVIGVGEVAVSDHRSTQPTFEEFARVAAEARRGGILSGKAGVVNVHLGDGARGLSLLRRVVEQTEIPISQFLPTHVNRNPSLFEEGLAWAKAGGAIDFTTSAVPAFFEEGEVKCSLGLRRAIEAGVDVSRITFTSDGQGSLPSFDERGVLKRLEIGRVTSLWSEIRDAVRDEGLALETVLPVGTSNPARVLKLRRKGEIAAGADADLILVDPAELTIHGVLARGRWLMRDAAPQARGTFE